MNKYTVIAVADDSEFGVAGANFYVKSSSGVVQYGPTTMLAVSKALTAETPVRQDLLNAVNAYRKAVRKPRTSKSVGQAA
jgi:hypothetical protein